MEFASRFIFAAASAILGFGMFRNIVRDAAIGGTGTMAMNTYYLLAIALFAAAAAAELIWGRRNPDTTQQQ